MTNKQEDKPKPTGLDLLREPFPANQISKLPKPTKRQTDEVRADFKKGIRCQQCGQWHHPDVVHLDYVGHAALTDRLLDCDPQWNWEPTSWTELGHPVMDANGGMWIKLTVCGVTRFGYGHPDGKKGGDAIKEVIGDALRNAAMRFGAALDLWHKGELHVSDDAEQKDEQPKFNAEEASKRIAFKLSSAQSLDDLAKNQVNQSASCDRDNVHCCSFRLVAGTFPTMRQPARLSVSDCGLLLKDRRSGRNLVQPKTHNPPF